MPSMPARRVGPAGDAALPRMRGAAMIALSPRDRRIVLAVARNAGASKLAARELGLAEGTVRNAMAHIYAITGTRSRTELWIALGWLDVPKV